MKLLTSITLASVAVAVIAAAQPSGSFSTFLTWDPYTDTNAVLLRLIVKSGTVTNIYTVTNINQNTITIPVQIGSTNRATLVAVNQYGLESDPSNELVWSIPTKPAIPATPRVVVIQYIP